jgi:tetratricopeptide (TPR) repeat protein
MPGKYEKNHISLCQGRLWEELQRSHGLVNTMKKFAGCLSLAMLTVIATSGCNKTGHQSSLATPSLPALIGNTDKLESQLSIARIQEHQGQLREAAERYTQLAKKNPNNATIPHRLGVIESKNGNHQAANQFFRRSLELEPHDAEVLTDWGYSLFLQGKLSEAETALRMALNEVPGEERATNNLALVLGHAGKPEESLALFRQVSGEASAWVNLGYVHVSLGEGEKAAECFAKALSLDDKLESAANALVQIAELQQQATQRTARQQQIASSKAARSKVEARDSADSIVQVVAELPAGDVAHKDSAVSHAHATVSAKSSLPVNQANHTTSAPSK